MTPPIPAIVVPIPLIALIGAANARTVVNADFSNAPVFTNLYGLIFATSVAAPLNVSLLLSSI